MENNAPQGPAAGAMHALLARLAAKKQAEETSRTVRDWRRPALTGYAIIVFAFGVLGSWAAFARLDSAVVAPGIVSVESNRKIIAHFEGGIVRQILVKEGQRVSEGELLVRLDDTQSKAGADMAAHQLAGVLALEARLMAERDHADRIVFPEELLSTGARHATVAQEAMVDQQKQFEERRASLLAQVALLEARVRQYQTELGGLAQEKASAQRQVGFITDELADLRMLLEKQLVQKSRVLALEREKSRLEGVIGRSTADAAKANNGIGEASLQIDQLRKKFAEEVNGQLLDTRSKIADLRERTRVSADVYRRVGIVAPQAGVVQNLKVATLGGVVRPGEPLMELIPDGDSLVINIQVAPGDIDVVAAGMAAEVMFDAFRGKQLPIIMGKILTLSSDRLTDEVTRQPYFLARVIVEDGQLPVEIRGKIVAGMQGSVVIPTGSRTMVDYLVRPLSSRTRKAMREQ